MWLPLTISGTTASMKNPATWVVDVAAGTLASGPSETSYEGEDAQLSGGAKLVSCDGCSGKKAAGYIGGTDSGAVTFSNISSATATRTTIRIRYVNGDKNDRYVKISVNGGPDEVIAFLSTDISSSSFHANLKAGMNTIKISGNGSGWGPDIDRLLVPK